MLFLQLHKYYTWFKNIHTVASAFSPAKMSLLPAFFPSPQTCEQRQVSHFQYLSWPDYGVPTSAVTLIDFLGAVKRQQRKMVNTLGPQWTGHPQGPPMVVHCSAGIGRTGEILTR